MGTCVVAASLGRNGAAVPICRIFQLPILLSLKTKCSLNQFHYFIIASTRKWTPNSRRQEVIVWRYVVTTKRCHTPSIITNPTKVNISTKKIQWSQLAVFSRWLIAVVCPSHLYHSLSTRPSGWTVQCWQRKLFVEFQNPSGPRQNSPTWNWEVLAL